MKIIFFTGNSPRHIALCNKLSELVDESIVFSEVKENYNLEFTSEDNVISNHFKKRLLNEINYFSSYGNSFRSKCIPLKFGDSSSLYVEEIIRKFKPDCAIISGSSIIKDNILKKIQFIPKLNLHLGITPFFRGSGCNFWPLYLNQPEYVGASIIELDRGIDTGSLIHQFNEKFLVDDDIHSLGNRVIIKSIKVLQNIIEGLIKNRKYKITKQQDNVETRVYKNSDFNEKSFNIYMENLKNKKLLINNERYKFVDEKLIKLEWL
tara:strand:+ start:4690 stop:5481 length:792 start_codon:yes stop_codon:yes gene_type:complete